MAPGTERGAGQPAGNSAPRAVFREEPDRLVLSNQSLSIAFSRLAGGAIVSLHQPRTGLDLIDAAEATAEGSLWRINLVSKTGAKAVITSRSCDQFSHRTSPGDGGAIHLHLEWTALRVGAARLDGRVTAAFTFPAAAAVVLAVLEFDLPEGISVGSVEFPRLTALGGADPALEESIFLPLSDGVLIPDPRPLLARDGGRTWTARYPGPASLQLLGFSCGHRATAWLASRDVSGARKALVAAATPNSSRIALWLDHQPRTDGSGKWALADAVAVGLAAGDWYEAAREYRAWAILQPWCARGRTGVEHRPPALTAFHGMWLSHSGDAQSAVTAVRELLRQVNAPVRLDWHEWHQAPPPDYFPPRDGDQGFAQAVRELAESGVYVQLALDGLPADPRSQAWPEANALLAANADPPEGLSAVCPGAEYWPKKIASLAAQGTSRGAEGIYLTHLGTAGDGGCTNEAHAHNPGEPSEWARRARRVFAEVRRAVGDSYHLASDGPAEPYLDLLDAFVSPHAAAERAALFSDDFGTRCQPIPLFAAVYHEYCAETAVGPSLTNARPGGAPMAPTHLLARDCPVQFCLEIGRALVWGRQLALRGFSPEQGREERYRRKLAFLAAGLRTQTWGIGAFLPHAEFLGPLTVDAPAVEVELLANAWGDEPRLLRRRMSPVVGAAWRAPGAGTALVMANLHEHPVEFSALLRASRLGGSAPLHLIGRTFSEDGDAPAATLRSSGMEITGRLPARCFILITV